MFSLLDNPLTCNCQIIWLKSWLLESSSIGPKCADGTYVKQMPFSRNDCLNYPTEDVGIQTCSPLENEALQQPNLATSQVFSTRDKIKEYETQIKNNYGNRNNNRPLPQESDYFYDDYVDYPYNETIIDHMNNEINQTRDVNKNVNHNNIGNTPTLYAAINNTNHKTGVALKVPQANSGFTFFGYPLPSIDMGQLLGNGRKIDWTDQKNPTAVKKFPEVDEPKFETGGFSPMLPSTTNGFTPIINPLLNTSRPTKEKSTNLPPVKSIKMNETVILMDKKLPSKISHNTTMHKKVQSEIHELEAYHDDNNKTHVAYNKTKNIQEQNADPFNVRKYNLMESNITIAEVTEKEHIITTDSNDMTLQDWLETSSVRPTTSTFNERKIEKIYDNQPSVVSSVFVADGDIVSKNMSRTATITKVNMPHAEHYDLRNNNYSPVVNREPKNFFDLHTESSKARQTENNDWYYENYNKSNLEPYIEPGIYSSSAHATWHQHALTTILLILIRIKVI
ncbi:uncharacterized protein LOC121728791 [Aricia agestis]|uniref:uncharacterized protein LOC121728791 n=1 Tax=Aricia agestis TaxID=91739 RepID=UPI001C206D32|nr:uncharacterized protein LOC121728791 [Aricia agestis]